VVLGGRFVGWSVLLVSKREKIMKMSVVLAAALLAMTAVSHGEGFSVGAHGAYTIGGDVESEEFGYGLQAGVELGDRFSLELSGSMLGDEYDADEFGELDADVQHIALTARADIPINDTVGIYLGGGLSYNMIDTDEPSIPDLISSVATPAEQQMFAHFTDIGGTIDGAVDIDVDDAVGYHICGGVAVALSDSVELFGEYRFTWVDIDAEGSARVTATLGGAVVEERTVSGDFDGSHNFGLARIGVNVLL